MISKLKSIAKTFIFYKGFAAKEFENMMNLTIQDRLSMLKLGFHGESKYVFGIDESNHGNYLTDIQQAKTWGINKSYKYVLNNKLVFEKLFKNDIPIPKTLGVIEKGKILNGYVIHNKETLLEYLVTQEKVVLKPISGSGGHGVFVFQYIKDELSANGEVITKEQLEVIISEVDDYFFSEYVIQSDFSKKLYPGTINTMRILTMIDPDTNKSFIPLASQRMGTKKSAPADNISSGGLTAEIDLDTGKLSKGAMYPYNGEIIWHTHHPETNALIEGLTVPRWEETKQAITRVHNEHPYIKYIGWDVVTTTEGVSIIEANNCSGMRIIQIHRPLLTGKRVKRFFKYHGII